MIIETTVKKQGNSNVIILPRQLHLKPADKVRVIVMKKNVSLVKDAAGIFEKESNKIDSDKMLREVKKELWGDE